MSGEMSQQKEQATGQKGNAKEGAKKQVEPAGQAPSDKPKKARGRAIGRTVSWVMMVTAWVGASVIASQLIVGYTALWLIGAERIVQPVPTAIISALSYLLAMALIIFLPPRIAKAWRTRHKGGARPSVRATHLISREQIGLNSLPTWTDIGLAPVGFVVYLLLAAGLTALFSMFSWFNAEQVQDVGFNTYLSGGDRVIALVVLVIIAPIAEEIIFRGWLYSKLKGRLSHEMSEIWSIIITTLIVSLLFGAVHMQWNVGVNVFALSLVMCALREITGTIYAGILLHMLKNGVAFYLLYVAGIG